MIFHKTFKPVCWFDTKTEKTEYGIDIIFNGKSYHCSINGKPLLFGTEQERDKKLEELKKK